jgi:hypothetical protein
MKQQPNAAIGGGQMGLWLIRDVIVAADGGKCSNRLGTAGLAPSKDAMLFWATKSLDVDARGAQTWCAFDAQREATTGT